MIYPHNMIGLLRFFARIKNLQPLFDVMRFNRTDELDIRLDGHLLRFNDLALENVSNLYEIYGKENYKCNGDVNTVLDLGAYQGFYSLYAMIRYPRARIYAYEPLLSNYHKLLENIRKNNLAEGRFMSFNMAVADRKGKQDLYVNSQAEMGSSLMFRTAQSIQVDSVTMADIFHDNNLETVDVLKMDIEGAEYGVIRSADSEIMRRINNIIAELHPMPGEDICDFIQLLRELGFFLKSVDKPGMIYFFTRGCCN